MANAGKNSNTSQFFIVLTNDSAQHAKLNGKYVCFGQVVEGERLLDELDAAGTESGAPTVEVWIDSCGIL